MADRKPVAFFYTLSEADRDSWFCHSRVFGRCFTCLSSNS